MPRKPSSSTRVFGQLHGVDPARRRALAAIKSRFATVAEPLSEAERVALELQELRPGLIAERHVGEGGMASVHAALDHGLRRRVAVKLMHPSLELSERDEARFVEEAQLTGQMEHPNIAPIHEIGVTAEGRLYFAMKLVSGRSLAEVLATIRPEARAERDLHELVKVLVKVCDALEFAHAHGVVHRDLKPENVLVGDFGEVYVMDWGIAVRLASADRASLDALPFPPTEPLDRLGTIIGTPEFMAPEQALGELHRIEPRTDVFGLGGVLYQVLTGRPPHREADDDRTIAAAQRGAVTDPRDVRPDVASPPMLCAVAMRALAADPADRHPSARAFQEDLERYLRGGSFFPERTFEAGEWIVHEGEVADSAFVITSGACEALRKEATGWVVLRRMEAGEVFGETAIFAESRRSASVRAATPMRVTVVSRDALLGELDAGSWITPFVRTLAQRFAEQSNEVAMLRRRVTVAEVGARAVRLIARREPGSSPEPGGLEADLDEVVAALAGPLALEPEMLRSLLHESPEVVVNGTRIRVAAPTTPWTR